MTAASVVVVSVLYVSTGGMHVEAVESEVGVDMDGGRR